MNAAYIMNHLFNQTSNHTSKNTPTYNTRQTEKGIELALAVPGYAKESFSISVEDAKKKLDRIPIQKGTLPHEQKGKYGGARVFLKPASEGTGVIAGGAVRAVLDAVGIQNVLSKSQGSSNPHNVVKATFDALLKLRSPEIIANERGISIDKVFNG